MSVAPVDPKVLSTLLPCGPFREVRVVESTGSTNADLAALARGGEPSGVVLFADHQETGRGRFARAWVDTPGTNIAVSALLRPQVEVARWGWLSVVAGIGVVDALRAVTGLPVALKWPNDVLLEPGTGVVAPGKLVGILAERVETPTGVAAVIGMGINVSMTREQLPVETATSLALNGSTATKTEIALALLRSWAEWLVRWESGDDLRAAYVKRCLTIGRHVRAQIDAELGRGTVVAGRAVDIDLCGSLIVETAAGRVELSAGDVIHLRPTEA